MVNYSPNCCIVIPVYRCSLLAGEMAALNRCVNQLSDYLICIVVPSSLRFQIEETLSTLINDSGSFFFVSIPDSWLSSIDSYNYLMLEPWFYKIFDKWEYILVHQLDAMIIDGKRLASLILMKYSYVGGCFVVPSRLPFLKNVFWRIYGGNGGLSLRRVNDMISLLESPDFPRKPIRTFAECLSYLLMRSASTYSNNKLSFVEYLSIIFTSLLMSLGHKNTLLTMDKTRTCQEDFLFSVFAPRYFKWFRVPVPSISAQFFVDANPEVIFKRHKPANLLGCHGWEKNNPSFWKRVYPNIFFFNS
jgi:hypothetical protein